MKISHKSLYILNVFYSVYSLNDFIMLLIICVHLFLTFCFGNKLTDDKYSQIALYCDVSVDTQRSTKA